MGDRQRVARIGIVVLLLGVLIGAGVILLLESLFVHNAALLPPPFAFEVATPTSIAPAAKPAATQTVRATTATPIATATSVAASGVITHYVSSSGDGSDGRSWQTAWRSPDHIEWYSVQPGDVIVLDGGQKSITYQGGMVVTRSGEKSAPITIRISDEPGRNGQVILFGGRSTPLPYCGQPDYVFQYAAAIGIEVNASWIVIDGGKWSGIVIHGFNGQGVLLESDSQNVTLRNLEIYDNGASKETINGWRSDEEGINLAGYNHTFERLIIHDNGQDEIQSGGAIGNFTLRESWMYNGRSHPNDPSTSFNACMHSDGLQLWTGGTESGVTVDNSIFGPGLMHGLLLGEESTNTVVNDVVVRDSLFIDATNASIHNQSTHPRNWLLERITSVRAIGAKSQNVFFSGSKLTIKDSLFVGGLRMDVPKDGNYNHNCEWQVDGTVVGDTVDPDIAVADPINLDNPALGDYKAQSPTCAGSHLTSTEQLFK